MSQQHSHRWLSDLPRAVRWRFVAWSGIVIAMFVVFAWRVLPAVQYETDLLALLPHDQQDRELSEIVDRFSQQMSGRVIFLIGADEVAQAQDATRRFAADLHSSAAFSAVQWQYGSGIAEQMALYRPHAYALLTARDALVVRSGQSERLYRQALQHALTPVGLMRPVGLADDPLGLFSNFLVDQLPAVGRASLEGEFLIARYDSRTYAVVVADCRHSPFASDYQKTTRAAIAKAIAAARAAAPAGRNEIEVIESGALQHATAAAQRAENEVAWFGTASTVVMLLIVLLVLRGIRPIILSAAVLAISLAMALTVAYSVFGRIHLLALVFGSSLIGVVIDYALHYLVDRFRNPGEWSAVAALQHIAPAILWGCIATACGYAGLTLVPLPGLQQIALFCFVGSITGCVSVLCLFPVFARGGPPPARIVLRWAQNVERWLRELEHRRAWRIGVIVVLSGVIVGGMLRVSVQDDLRALQAPNPELAAAEQRAKAVLGASIESGFFVVRGATEESLLQAQEQLATVLQQLVEHRALTGYIAISRAIPSLATQQANGTLMRERVLQRQGPYERVLQSFGYSAQTVEERRVASLEATQPLDFSEWLASPAAQPLRPFWLGKVGAQYASVVTVSGISDLSAVTRAGADVPGVAWIDRVERISHVLRDYRMVATWMWAAVCGTVLVVLTMRFGWRVALRAALPCMLATVLTVALFGWLGLPVNLFVVLAMFLVVGLGIDYGLVLMHSHEARSTGVISVSLSSVTTAFAFGLLGFSSSAFIQAIGIALCLGITLSWLLALWWCLNNGQGARTS